MELSRYKFRRVGAAIFVIVAVALVGFAILWPPAISEVFGSRLQLLLIAGGIGTLTFLVDPTGWSQGIREFRKASDQVAQEIWKMLGDDDDNDPTNG